MTYKILGSWFRKDNFKDNFRGFALVVCSILYAVCDDHTDKIITAVMAILAIDSFFKPRSK